MESHQSDICHFRAMTLSPLNLVVNWPVFSERELRYMLSTVRLSSVCLSVTLVHPTQAVEIFGNICTAFGTLISHPLTLRKPSVGGAKHRGVAKYSDFGLIAGYISEMVQDRR